MKEGAALKKSSAKTLIATLLISLFSTLMVFAGEGLGAVPSRSSDNEKVWKYYGEDNNKLTNAWKYVRDRWYYFDEDGYSKQNTWAEIDGKWYYFDQWSVMLHDTTTPDGHTVGTDGVWIPTGDETAPVQETTTNN